jgi:hypothetical protein
MHSPGPKSGYILQVNIPNLKMIFKLSKFKLIIFHLSLNIS